MKTFSMFGVLLAASLSATAAHAQPDATFHGVSVIGQKGLDVQTSKPDANNLYSVRIRVADLDLATDAGMSTLQSRVDRGVVMLCDAAGEQPQVPGFYNAGERHCRNEAKAVAQSEIARLRDAARAGHVTADLGLTRSLALR